MRKGRMILLRCRLRYCYVSCYPLRWSYFLCRRDVLMNECEMQNKYLYFTIVQVLVVNVSVLWVGRGHASSPRDWCGLTDCDWLIVTDSLWLTYCGWLIVTDWLWLTDCDWLTVTDWLWLTDEWMNRYVLPAPLPCFWQGCLLEPFPLFCSRRPFPYPSLFFNAGESAIRRDSREIGKVGMVMAFQPSIKSLVRCWSKCLFWSCIPAWIYVSLFWSLFS